MKCQNPGCQHEGTIALFGGGIVCPSCSLLLDDRPGRGTRALPIGSYECTDAEPTGAREESVTTAIPMPFHPMDFGTASGHPRFFQWGPDHDNGERKQA